MHTTATAQNVPAQRNSSVVVYRYGVIRGEKSGGGGGGGGGMPAQALPNINVPTEMANPVQPGTQMSDPSNLPAAMAAP